MGCQAKLWHTIIVSGVELYGGVANVAAAYINLSK